MRFTIAIPEKVSLNKIYAGVHWSKRKQWADDMHMAVLSAKIAPYSGLFPVDAKYHFKLNGTLLDSSNATALGKMCEDGLVRAGVLPDDNRKYIRWFAVLSDKTEKGEMDTVEVEFVPTQH